MPTEIIDMFDDAHCCECAICGGHRAAYSYPPVCKEPNCRFEWELETGDYYTMPTEPNQWAKALI